MKRNYTVILIILSLLLLGSSLLYGQPVTPGIPTWKVVSGKISNTISYTINASPGNIVETYQVKLYKSGNLSPIHSYNFDPDPDLTANTELELDCSSQMATDFAGSSTRYESYFAVVTASNSYGSTDSGASAYNNKGMNSLSLIGILAFGSNPADLIYNKLSSTTFNFQPFSYSSQTLIYNYMLRHEAGSVQITLPAANQNNPNLYSVKCIYNGVETSLDVADANGSYTIPMYRAQSSSGRDANGLPTGSEQNNVITIVVNKDTDFEVSYTIRLRRRIFCQAVSIADISPVAPASITGSTVFSSAITGGDGSFNPKPSEVNGDTIATYQYLNWSAFGISGSGYFVDNVFYPLSNGTVRIKAETADGSHLVKFPVQAYTVSGQANWYPHLGSLEITNARSPFQTVYLDPPFSANRPSGSIYNIGIIDDFSTVALKTMAPSDCQVFVNGVRISNLDNITLRIQPKSVQNPYNQYVVRVVNAQGERNYTLKIERDVNPRLRYGRETGSPVSLTAPSGTYFGMNSPTVNQAFTIQAWVRWTSDPYSNSNTTWASIATMDHSSDQGQFWLQHNSANTAFEWAFRVKTGASTTTRQYVQSTTIPQRGVWYLLTGVWTGSSIILYVNGTAEATRSLSGTFNTLPATPLFSIGRSPSTGFRYFPGNIKNLRLWVGTARSATQIANDYNGIPSEDNSTYFWPLEETSPVATVVRSRGEVDLTMNNALSTDFVACCANNMSQGSTLVSRPARIDLATTDSETVLFVGAQNHTASFLKYSILGPVTAPSNTFEVWDHTTNTWKVPSSIGNGVTLLGDTSAGTRFWIMRRNTNTAGAGRYVDDGNDTSYDGNDNGAAGQLLFNTIAPLPPITAMISPFTITGSVTGGATYPTTRKYVVLGYNELEYGTLVAACSTPVTTSKSGKGTVTFYLKSDQTLKRIEIRTLDDILITQYLNPDGWSGNATLEDQTLPIVLSGFLVTALGQTAQIRWATASETNILGFRIYRNSSVDFSNALRVSGLIEGTNTTTTQNYLFTDTELPNPGLWYYWLEVMEFDGGIQNHGPVSVQITEDGSTTPPLPLETGLTSVYPNPFSHFTQIKYGLAEDSDVRIRVFNLRGQLLRQWQYSIQSKGNYSIHWNDISSDLPNGLYLLRFEAGRHSETRRISLVK